MRVGTVAFALLAMAVALASARAVTAVRRGAKAQALEAEADSILAELRAEHDLENGVATTQRAAVAEPLVTRATLAAHEQAMEAATQRAIALEQRKRAAAGGVQGVSMLEANMHAQVSAREQAAAVATAAAAAAAADATAYHYNGHAYHVSDGVDPCSVHCDRAGGWRDFACQDCIFHGLVNGWVGKVATGVTHPQGYNYAQWSRDYCVAYANKVGGPSVAFGSTGFSQCFLDQVHHSANL